MNWQLLMSILIPLSFVAPVVVMGCWEDWKRPRHPKGSIVVTMRQPGDDWGT